MRENAPAIVMNMFYTGLGIARSLGERGISVIGITAERMESMETSHDMRKVCSARTRARSRKRYGIF